METLIPLKTKYDLVRPPLFNLILRSNKYLKWLKQNHVSLIETSVISVQNANILYIIYKGLEINESNYFITSPQKLIGENES